MKINVAVLFGGKSVEHEVSVISAVQAMQNINKDRKAQANNRRPKRKSEQNKSVG